MSVDEIAIYVAAFMGPFVQEDAAIVSAVTAFLHPQTQKMASGPLIVVFMFGGLVISDLWKYWIGYAGRTQSWAKRMATKPTVSKVGSRIVAHPGKTLMLARFIPGTRIPAYLASGFFGVPFGRFAFWIVVSGLAYVAAAWVLLSTVGIVAGEKGQLYLAGVLVICLLVYAIVGVVKARRG
jgi:membrane protein DedA with SNARE-associated domain